MASLLNDYKWFYEGDGYWSKRNPDGTHPESEWTSDYTEDDWKKAVDYRERYRVTIDKDYFHPKNRLTGTIEERLAARKARRAALKTIKNNKNLFGIKGNIKTRENIAHLLNNNWTLELANIIKDLFPNKNRTLYKPTKIDWGFTIPKIHYSKGYRNLRENVFKPGVWSVMDGKTYSWTTPWFNRDVNYLTNTKVTPVTEIIRPYKGKSMNISLLKNDDADIVYFSPDFKQTSWDVTYNHKMGGILNYLKYFK